MSAPARGLGDLDENRGVEELEEAHEAVAAGGQVETGQPRTEGPSLAELFQARRHRGSVYH